MPLTQPGAASTTPHSLTHQQVAQAFDQWEREYRAKPESFLTDDEAAAMETATLSESRAITFFAYLRQVLGGAA